MEEAAPGLPAYHTSQKGGEAPQGKAADAMQSPVARQMEAAVRTEQASGEPVKPEQAAQAAGWTQDRSLAAAQAGKGNILIPVSSTVAASLVEEVSHKPAAPTSSETSGRETEVDAIAGQAAPPFEMPAEGLHKPASTAAATSSEGHATPAAAAVLAVAADLADTTGADLPPSSAARDDHGARQSSAADLAGNLPVKLLTRESGKFSKHPEPPARGPGMWSVSTEPAQLETLGSNSDSAWCHTPKVAHAPLLTTPGTSDSEVLSPGSSAYADLSHTASADDVVGDSQETSCSVVLQVSPPSGFMAPPTFLGVPPPDWTQAASPADAVTSRPPPGLTGPAPPPGLDPRPAALATRSAADTAGDAAAPSPPAYDRQAHSRSARSRTTRTDGYTEPGSRRAASNRVHAQVLPASAHAAQTITEAAGSAADGWATDASEEDEAPADAAEAALRAENEADKAARLRYVPAVDEDYMWGNRPVIHTKVCSALEGPAKWPLHVCV